ncbi:(2Fe-2S)-binding protein [Streptomyces cellulosae]|nr:(2Fe-2S)-binding protein [Streptomyces cellulosae]WTC54383.1 (2Fe-2S)-binding protein [Streptomyces cellulosae]
MVLLYVVDLDPRLTALPALGGFFALRAGEDADRHLPTLAQAYGPRRPDVQHAAATDPLTVRVRRVAAALRTQEPRVAASVAHQGLAARLWSVALGCAALHGEVPDLAPDTLHWNPESSAPDDLHLPKVRPLPGDAATLADVVLHGHLEPLSAALRARHRVAPALLRGNAASALAAAAREITRHARPDAAARAARLARELLAHPGLSGAGGLTATGFRRRSCCLYYRVPGGGVCGDCCFARPPRSSPSAPTA